MQRYPDPKDRFVRDLKDVEIKDYEITEDLDDFWFDPDVWDYTKHDCGKLERKDSVRIEAHPITISLGEKWPKHT